MNQIKMVDLRSQHVKLQSEINEAIQCVFEHCHFISGQEVSRFEQRFGDYLNCNHVISCGNCTDALQIALMAIEAKPGDEIIIPSFGYISSAEVIALLRLTPVFVDINLENFNISTEKIINAISKRTKAIIPVHLYGQMSDMTKIMEIVKNSDIYVIEDYAQSVGSMCIKSGQKSGTIGHIGCTSFFPTKNLACYGDGGALNTNDEELANRIRMIKAHGQKEKYHHQITGINSRLDTIQAAILNVKLKYLSDSLESRKNVAQYYNKYLTNIEGIKIPSGQNDYEHTFNQYTIRVKRGLREGLKSHLNKLGIPTIIYYPIPLHKQESMVQFNINSNNYPMAELASKEVLSLPMHADLNEDQLKYICSGINSFFN